MKSKQVVIWVDFISPHMSYLFKRLANEFDLTIIYTRNLDEDRRLQGWDFPIIQNANLVSFQNISRDDIAKYKMDSTLHVFSGVFMSFRHFSIVLKLCQYKNLCFIAEAPIFYRFKDRLKLIKYKILIGLLHGKIKKFYVMGDLGVNWYSKLGIPSDKLQKFQYVITPRELSEVPARENDGIKFIFIGQFIERKGIFELVDVVKNIELDNWTLDFYGDGELREYINRELSDKIENGHVSLKGNVNNKILLEEYLPCYDYLILPSRYDGWGTVINEALMKGVRVITNHMCGASALINEKFGYVYNTDNELFKIITTVIIDKLVLDESSRKEISQEYIHNCQGEIIDNLIVDFKNS